MPFDIRSLHDFHPPQVQCESCLAIYPAASNFLKRRTASDYQLICSACHIEYLPTDAFNVWRLEDYLASVDRKIVMDDATGHARTLATIAVRLQSAGGAPVDWFPPMRALLEALSSARSFV